MNKTVKFTKGGPLPLFNEYNLENTQEENLTAQMHYTKILVRKLCKKGVFAELFFLTSSKKIKHIFTNKIHIFQ